MLYYSEIALSPLEVPGEVSICIYISGCTMHCSECHYPELQMPDYGDPLHDNFNFILDAYSSVASCVCILGEGDASDKEELISVAYAIKWRNLKVCLYSGRDTNLEPWMEVFDYVKVGSYNKAAGPLDSRNTNQRMYWKTGNGYKDITNLFWEDERQIGGVRLS